MTGLNGKTVSMALALILFVEAAALADGNTQTMGISCFIPAIPGVNVPLDEKQAPREQKPVVREQIIQSQQEKQEEPSYGFGYGCGYRPAYGGVAYGCGYWKPHHRPLAYMESQTIALPAYAIAEDTQEVRAAEQVKTPQLVRVKTFYSR